MTRPAVYFTTVLECRCGRAKYTNADADRWFREVEFMSDEGAALHNPAWARAICWTPGYEREMCRMKPLP